MNKLRQYTTRIAVWTVIVIFGLATGGCWDQRELQDRNFVLAVGVDLAETQADGKKAQLESFIPAVGDRRYQLSLQVYRPSERRSRRQAGAASSGDTFVISDIGQSIFEMVRDMWGQSSKALYFEHIQAIVISQAVVQQHGLRPILDFFMRDPEMRARMKVFVTSGTARAILDYKPPTGEPGGLFLNNIASNYPINVHLVGRLADIGALLEVLDNKGDPILPRVEVADGVLKVGGLALFKRDRFVAFMDEYITQGKRFIFATEKQAPITITCPEHPDELIVFLLRQQQTKLLPHVDGDKLYFTLDIAMKGDIQEVGDCKGKRELMKGDFLKKLEPLFAEEVKRNVYDSFTLCQQYGVDAYKLGLRLKAYQPKTWAKIKEQWDDIYPTVPLVVSVNVTINGIGEHK